MVKRLFGFAVLIVIVALVLQWVSLQQSEPEQVKEVDVQVTSAPKQDSQEPPPEESEVPVPPTPDQATVAPLAVEEPPPSEPESPSDTAADEEKVSPAEPESSASPVSEQASPPSLPAEEEKLPEESEPPAPTAPPVTEEPPPAESEPPSGAAEGESAPPADEEETAPATPAPPSTPPAQPEPVAPEAAEIEEHLVSDEEFVAIEQAQGRTDERTDAQRRHQDEDGWYGWGVLSDYSDPDRAARLLGGAAVVQTKGRFFMLREKAGGQVVARPIADVSAAYGSIALRGHGSAFKGQLHRALSAGELLGRAADFKLWFLFPRREATHLGNKVVKVFECHIRESGVSGEAADRFREQSRLRGAVLLLRRANGGRLGIYLPDYFQTGEEGTPVSPACRAIDEESRRFES